MSRVPGALWVPSPYHGGLRRKGRGMMLHVAVSEARQLAPRPDASWHLYIAKNGMKTQYIDSDYVAWAAVAGNATMFMVETQGGVVNPNEEPWTDEQVEALAEVYAWLHDDEDAPLQLMLNSLSTSRGLGYHRLGVDPWRLASGEIWSGVYGKICPGNEKIKQVPTILNRAKVLVKPSKPILDLDSDMLYLVTVQGKPGIYGLIPGTVYFHLSPSLNTEWRNAKAVPVPVTQTVHEYLLNKYGVEK